MVASQYRETQEGTGQDEFGGDDVHDVSKLLDFLDLCAFANHNRMVMMGESRGSIMTFEILRVDDRVKAAVVTGSVSDLAGGSEFHPHANSGRTALPRGRHPGRSAFGVRKTFSCFLGG